ncbi:MAG: OB-fold domain-containing protein [Deltaproteobacteria bacterium]|nr:OB-fold domain-containing protein [Deltaproteobacteria bacterium]
MPESIIKQYYDALGQGKLLGKKCRQCGAVTFPPTTACEACGSPDQESAELSGRGNLLYVSHGMAPPPNPRFAEIAPYAYGHIRLEEGVYVQAIITGVAVDPATLQGFFERGPCAVEPDIRDVGGLNVLAFKVA